MVKVIKDEKMAHDSLALAEKSEWISRSGRLQSSSAKREKKRPNKIRTTTGDKENKSTIDETFSI